MTDSTRTPWLVATDLDGTLLDDRYPLDDAAAAIDAVSARGHRVALASSKTFVEMVALADRCTHPPMLIFENGAGIAWRESSLFRAGEEQRDGFEIELSGTSYDQLREILMTLRAEGYEFRGFADMDPMEVAERTKLSADAATLACERLASEPLSWEGDAQSLSRFAERLAEFDLHLEQGGRFHHVASKMTKARALGRLKRMIRYQFGEHPSILACGDAPNDLDMLKLADHALVFPHRNGGHLLPQGPATDHATAPGPAQWQEGVLRIIEPAPRGIHPSRSHHERLFSERHHHDAPQSV